MTTGVITCLLGLCWPRHTSCPVSALHSLRILASPDAHMMPCAAFHSLRTHAPLCRLSKSVLNILDNKHNSTDALIEKEVRYMPSLQKKFCVSRGWFCSSALRCETMLRQSVGRHTHTHAHLQWRGLLTRFGNVQDSNVRSLNSLEQRISAASDALTSAASLQPATAYT